jgi:hypothetical protein
MTPTTNPTPETAGDIEDAVAGLPGGPNGEGEADAGRTTGEDIEDIREDRNDGR